MIILYVSCIWSFKLTLYTQQEHKLIKAADTFNNMDVNNYNTVQFDGKNQVLKSPIKGT